MRALQIGSRRIADDEPCYVIAEIGHNHGGDPLTALKMIRMAAGCGVQAVKLQKRDVLNLYTRDLLEAPYEHEHSFGSTYGAHRLALELGFPQYVSLRAAAKASGVSFFATAFDEASVDLLMDVEVPAIKLASGDLTNTPLIRYAARKGVPLILSTGGGTEQDIARAVKAVGDAAPLALLHCTAAYPVRDFAELNLRCIVTLRERYPDVVIGWSGHDAGIAMAVAAYTLGARIIEKHVTLNRTSKGTDHAFSLEPGGLRRLVRDLSRAHVALGDGVKTRYASEDAPLRKMAKSLVAKRPLPEGHVLTEHDLARKSPAGGLEPYLLDELIGFPITQALATDEPLTYAHLTQTEWKA